MAGTIESRIALRGDITDVMKKMNTFQSRTNQINRKVQKSFNNTNRVVGSLGGMLAGLGVGMGFNKIIQASGDFQNSMARVKAITQATDSDFKKLSATAKQLGATTQFSASQAAEGLQYLGMAGYNTEQSIAALPHTLNLAAAGAIELGQAADIASNVVAGMGYDISQTERVIDVLAQTSRTANTDVSEMGEAAKKAAPVFAGLGLEIEELATASAIMANNGIKGADAGTAMAGALSRLLKQPKMVAEALDELGVSIDENTIKNDGFVGTLLRLQEAGISNTQMAAIFGDHWKNIGTIINTSSSEMERLSIAIGNSNGAAKQMAEEGIGPWQRGMNMLNSAIEGLMISLGEGGLLGIVTQFVTNLTSFIGYLGQMTGSFENAIPVLYAFATAATAAWAALTGGLSAIVTAVAVAVTGIITYWNDIVIAIEKGINAVIDFANKSTLLRTSFVVAIEYVKYFWEFMKTYIGFITSLFKELGGFIVDVFKSAWNEVESWFNGEDYSFIDNIGQEFSNMLKGLRIEATEAAAHLKTQLEGAVKEIADAYNGKEIAHVKLGLTTTKGAGSKAEDAGDVGTATKPQIKSIGEDFEFEEIPEQLEIIDSAVVNVNESLSSLGDSFSTIFDGASNSIGAFIGNVLKGIPKVIDNLKKLGVIQKQEALRQVVIDQARATSSGTASASSLPFPANLAAIAAVIATVTSVFASLPKFESGGVVGGSSYYGDKILARVNSKELILNRQQQASLYSQMNGSSEGSFTIGEARVRGGDIIYAIEYETKNRKRNG